MREQLAFFQRGGRRGTDIYNLANAEAIQYVNRAAVLEPAVLPVQIVREEAVVRVCSAAAMTVEYVKLFLAWLAKSGLGPTHVARRIYMFGMLVAAVWHWVAPAGARRIEGVKDGWNWNAGGGLEEPWERGVWLVHAVGELIGGVVSGGAGGGIDVTGVYALEQLGMGWNEEEQREGVAGVLARGGYSGFAAVWATWLTARVADGSASLPAPTVGEIVNLGLQLETASDVLPAFVDPGAWTPLKLPMKPAKQGYLTFHWNSVRSTGLTGEQEGDLRTGAGAFFPDEVERAAEVAEVVSITAGLTDTEKCTAEWWAGGPGTIAPPGMCLWWWKEYMEAVGLGGGSGVGVEGRCVGSLLDLGIHLFEASRLVWGLKAAYVQARPIQEIRRRYAGMTLIGYDGEGISGERWMPYQEVDFVTPPFADFPSGHSCFSQMGAAVMTEWFGGAVPTVGRRRTDLNLMSPMFAGMGASEGAFNRVAVVAGKSLVQTGVVPAAEVVLEWNTWQQMADSSGLSRLYGGIHCISAHTSSQHVANSAHQMLDEVWGIRRA
jgi:membrane-associated phospholipid phosphatase